MGSERQNQPRPFAIIALTRAGAQLGFRLSASLPGSVIFTPGSMGGSPFERLSDFINDHWQRFDAHIFIMAAGIVVRHIAPVIRHKATDPAVVVLDERGQYAVSLLSGHLGGANELARNIAGLLGGQAVITTASDVRGVPALDLIAQTARLKIENIGMLSRITSALLEDEIWVYDPHGHVGGLLKNESNVRIIKNSSAPGMPCASKLHGPGVWVSEFVAPDGMECLQLRPRNLVVGIGCNRGTSSDEIVGLIHSSLEQEQLSILSVRNLASIELKADELGLLQAAGAIGRPVLFYSREELERISVPNQSKVVKDCIGVSSVCEASALLSAGSKKLVVRKRKTKNATVAIAAAV